MLAPTGTLLETRPPGGSTTTAIFILWILFRTSRVHHRCRDKRQDLQSICETFIVQLQVWEMNEAGGYVLSELIDGEGRLDTVSEIGGEDLFILSK